MHTFNLLVSKLKSGIKFGFGFFAVSIIILLIVFLLSVLLCVLPFLILFSTPLIAVYLHHQRNIELDETEETQKQNQDQNNVRNSYYEQLRKEGIKIPNHG